MTIMLRCSLAACAIWASAGVIVPAPSPRESLLVPTPWLAQHINDPNLVILHIGTEAEYNAAHIPGARFVNYSQYLARHDDQKNLSLEMLTPDVLHDRLAALGISDQSRVVVYYGKDWVSPSTRVLFTLDYAGLGDRASMLDGGMGAWTRGGHPVTAEATAPPSPGTLAALRIEPEIVDAAFVQAHLKSPGYAVVDARAEVFYDGVQNGAMNGGPEKFGHIPGAHSVPFTEVTNDQLAWKSADELAALFTKAGVKPGDTVIGYCHIGQQATAMLFAARTLGHPVLLYDGSFEDWASHDYPVEKPAGKGSGR
jgi:thiosulfate/3-mercaptopyruvate sulfurtransferase